MNKSPRTLLCARRCVLGCRVVAVAGLWFAGAASLARAQKAAPPAENQPTREAQIQMEQPSGTTNATAPVTITLQDAIERARKYDAQFLAAVTGAESAHEDRLQARNAILPQFSYTTQALLTQGNGNLPKGTPSGRFVTNDGVHVYRAWAVAHEDLSPANYLGTTYHRAQAAEAIANATAEIAKRDLTVAVTKLYYALAVAQRKYATAQQALDTAKRFFTNAQDAENVGQAAHSDVIQAEIQDRQQEQAYQEASLAMESARLDLAVVLFPILNENFSVVDDLDNPVALPPFAEAERMAAHENPEMRVAMEELRAANSEVTAAKGAFLPAFFMDTDYGIEANDFALHSKVAADPTKGNLPNLGYFITVGVNVPVWDWGTLRSKFHQSELKREEARAELSQTQRLLVSNLYGSYNEATVAQTAVEESRHTAELAAESLRLINLRYHAGASSALEVVTGESSLTQARNAYDDAQVRYRVAIATLETLTGTF